MNDEEKTRADKISETVTAKYQAGYRNPFTGKQHDDESKKRMSESQKGKHSGPRKRKADTQNNPPDNQHPVTKYGVKQLQSTELPNEVPTSSIPSTVQITSKFPNETQTNSPIESVQTPQLLTDNTPQLPVHCFSHSTDDTVFYIGFGNDPADTTNMSPTWHSFVDNLEWKSVILDRDCTPKEVKELAKYYLDLYSPAVNLQEIKLADEEELLLGMSARDRRLSEQSEYGDNVFIPYGQEDDDVPKESYVNDYGYTIEPPGTEQIITETVKTGTHVDNDGNEYDTWVDTSPQKKETIKPVVDKELEQRKQLEAMRQTYKRALETPEEEIDDNEDYSGRETIIDI